MVKMGKILEKNENRKILHKGPEFLGPENLF